MRLLVAELKKRRCAAVKPRQRGADALTRQRGADALTRQRGAANLKPSSSLRRRESVPAAVQRTVWSRDGSRCTYVDGRGKRCRETALLELHHLHPEARGGPPTVENLTLRCRAHNALAAEQDFGRDFMETKRQTGSKTIPNHPGHVHGSAVAGLVLADHR
jgi:5-methylcytosine-specific restriction endonuclease McrA